MGSKLRLVLMVGGGLVGLAVVAVGGGYLWASSAAAAKLARVVEVHDIDIPVPFPLDEAELEALRAELLAARVVEDPDGADEADDAEPVDPLEGLDLEALALERAVERGRHLVQARYACFECHGADMGGATMVEDSAVGSIHGPNLTAGEGGRMASLTVADWDRVLRHGVNPDGRPSLMPSQDFFAMSDQELSDILAYMRTLPPVDRTMPESRLGPLITVLLATGGFVLSYDQHPDHARPHAMRPPDPADTLAFGQHLAQVCVGCHGGDLAGGPIAAGPPDWPPAADLRYGGSAYTFEAFERVMREGIGPAGEPVQAPMFDIAAMGKNMTEQELKAMWAYLESLSPG